MLTSKQRAALRAMSNGVESILQVGKGGVGQQLIQQVDDALEARELVKLTVLETAPETARELAGTLAQATRSQVVQVIGRKVVLYRKNHEKPVIKLPK